MESTRLCTIHIEQSGTGEFVTTKIWRGEADSQSLLTEWTRPFPFDEPLRLAQLLVQAHMQVVPLSVELVRSEPSKETP